MESNDTNKSVEEMTKQGVEEFYFHGLIESNSANVVIFISQSKLFYLPIIMDFQRFNVIKGFVNKVLSITSCGIYSLLLFFIDKSKQAVSSIFLSFNDYFNMPTVNLVIVDKKNKVQTISNLFVLAEDAAVCSVIYGVPILISDKKNLDFLAFPLGEIKDVDLINALEEKILENEKAIENNN